MKKFSAAVLIVGASALYIFMRTPEASAVLSPPASASGSVTTAPSAPSGNVPPPLPTPGPATPQPAPAPAPQPVAAKGMYKDGTYTGPSVDAFYGYVKVQATVSGGKLTDVTFLSYPSDRDTSRYINSQAMPYLTQEALSAQSANVNIISGATDTSLAFRQSLSAALAKAANS